MTTISPKVEVSRDEIAAFCQRWQITEFALFGSILRDDFRPDSDVDVLVSFAPEAKWSLWDIIKMKEELKTMFRRKVDLVEKECLRNPFRRYEILSTKQVIYLMKLI
ncbi:MAG: nucleotidyltransferase domain-containing protein [Coleofasciculus sp. D1-CHI-01]|uniref:nucleotidyltransferase family protein n=1 Tax=Coleofasciculus sp. D1-CHI-01 TaxID=3068482 RepID=UPI0032F5B6F4